VRVRTRVWERRREGVCSLSYDPRPTPYLLRVGMKLSDPDLLKTAEPLIYKYDYSTEAPSTGARMRSSNSQTQPLALRKATDGL
jgi:hypothetical protein